MVDPELKQAKKWFAFVERILLFLFTGADNQTFDIGRVLWCLCVLAALVFQSISVFHTHQFNMQDFGVGMGGLLFGGGASIWIKRGAEPAFQQTTRVERREENTTIRAG
jgi:hypothetical protein